MNRNLNSRSFSQLPDRQKKEMPLSLPQHPSIIKVTPLGTHKNFDIIAEYTEQGKVNYLIGNDPKKWKTNIPVFKTIVYKELYKNVDMRFYGNSRQMEYDVIIKPGGNPARVRFSCRGIKNLAVTEKGDMEMHLKDGRLLQKKPYIYQEIEGKRVEREGAFRVQRAKYKTPNPKQCIYGFQVASYDKRYPLVIDPVFVYSTYLGGNNSDGGHGIAVDAQGNAYVIGETRSHDFPSISAIFRNKAGDTKTSDIFITKLDASGQIVYSTYLGGSDDDIGKGIAVDTSENVCITGGTNSTDFPLSSAIQNNKGGETDAFITKINASGDNLLYSTYLGGDNSDCGQAVALDKTGNAYITGWTYSHNYPVIHAGFGNKAAGARDAFITKINASGNTLIYSLYLGGANHDIGNGIAVDNSGNAYITGSTNSIDFPTASALLRSYAGGYHDAFITKIHASGNKLLYSTYLGGNNDDVGYNIAVDTSGNAYSTGMTWSTNFPTVSPLYKTIAGNNDAFITKLDASGKEVLYSTYLGGSTYDGGYGIAVDYSGNAYITGVTQSHDFPTTSTTHRKVAGDDDAFMTKLDTTGSKIMYSICPGGDNNDVGCGIAVDPSGNAYITGKTWSDNFPVSSAIYRNKAGDCDAFITKITTGKERD